MKKRRLGKSAMVVSEIGMGTMTFGSSCDEPTSFKILDKAYDAGIDFYDTAEIYPVPPEDKWVHRTEEIVGKWLKTKPRDSVLIATKVCGPGHGWFTPPVRSGKTALDRHHIIRAIQAALRRQANHNPRVLRRKARIDAGQYRQRNQRASARDCSTRASTKSGQSRHAGEDSP
jgi:aryl-alcohol dehydrogenase-like predicted oxidoreductase